MLSKLLLLCISVRHRLRLRLWKCEMKMQWSTTAATTHCTVHSTRITNDVDRTDKIGNVLPIRLSTSTKQRFSIFIFIFMWFHISSHLSIFLYLHYFVFTCLFDSGVCFIWHLTHETNGRVSSTMQRIHKTWNIEILCVVVDEMIKIRFAIR